MHLKPSENQQLFGMSSFFSEIKNLYIQKKMPNQILLSGKKGLGKSTLAYHVINFILSGSAQPQVNSTLVYLIYSLAKHHLNLKKATHLPFAFSSPIFLGLSGPLKFGFYLIYNKHTGKND